MLLAAAMFTLLWCSVISCVLSDKASSSIYCSFFTSQDFLYLLMWVCTAVKSFTDYWLNSVQMFIEREIQPDFFQIIFHLL